jgi:hypothetical protein
MGIERKAESCAIIAARFEVPLAVRIAITTAAIFCAALFASPAACDAELSAGAAKVDITNRDAGPVNDPLYAKALVLKDDSTTMVIVTVDAVAIAGIGTIKNEYLANVRAQLQKDPGIPPEHVLINASHCHGVVCADVEQRTLQAVREAWKRVVPVTVGAGRGREDRVSQNRRLKLINGKEADVRHAYSLPPDEEVTGVGPIDPEIGILRLDRKTGGPLAVVYNFACHPIQGVPSRGNTADLTGFASQAIEDSLGEGTTALFLQGCAGDINPAFYKDVDHPRDAELLGNRLALSTLKAVSKIRARDNGFLKVIREKLELPRADLAPRIDDLVAEQARLLKSLKGTSLNLKTFLPLAVKYKLSEFPSYYSHGYLHEKLIGRDDLEKLDAGNRENLAQYIRNIHTMEELTRAQTNLDLLRMHHAQNVAAGKRTIDVEVLGVRIADFIFVTFPGEPTVEIGLKIKKNARHDFTFVVGYTNGYIYYAPTAEQLQNVGNAQEDSDCLLAPEWQALFEAKVAEILMRI